MRRAGWFAAVLLALVPVPRTSAHPVRNRLLYPRITRRLHGHIDDYTANHGTDRRIWSPALCQRRDMYVYLPPGYDPHRRYPLILWLHGFAQDESVFLRNVIEPLDQAMACGQLPPAIIAAPDGSLKGLDCLLSPGSFYLNTQAGPFEDYLMVDVWNFVFEHYPIRPEAAAHVAMGVSMGGGAAFNKAIKYSDRIGVAVGIFPPLNLRWMNCHGRYLANFDPGCWGWRTDFSHSHEVLGRFFGVITIRMRHVLTPLYGRNNPDTASEVSRENPIEMLDLYNVQPGQIEMYIAYAGRDQFNIDAQVESFLYRARQRGLCVGVGYAPKGHHDRATAFQLMPGLFEWLAPRLAPYSPVP